ncbi:MAG: hypothetical protein ACT4OS_04210 [Acidimicrobiales bacterium]
MNRKQLGALVAGLIISSGVGAAPVAAEVLSIPILPISINLPICTLSPCNDSAAAQNNSGSTNGLGTSAPLIPINLNLPLCPITACSGSLAGQDNAGGGALVSTPQVPLNINVPTCVPGPCNNSKSLQVNSGSAAGSATTGRA